MNILVTGATGIVGREVLERLRERLGGNVVGVSRRGDERHGVVRWPMGIEPCPAHLRDIPWDAVVHGAADIRWNLTDEDAYRANLRPAEDLLGLLTADTTVVHVSTAFAVGLGTDVASPDRADYRNSYEWSKAAAERTLDRHGPCWTVRPPMIIGSRRNGGRIERFHGVYQVVQAALWGALPVIVAQSDGPVELVAVDDVAELVVDCVAKGPPAAKEILVMGRGAEALTGAQVIAEAFDEINVWRRNRQVEPVTAPPVISPQQWERFFRPFAEKHLSRSQLALMHALDPYLPYWAMRDHVGPNVIVDDVREALRSSVRYWADRHPAAASTTPRPWRGVG